MGNLFRIIWLDLTFKIILKNFSWVKTKQNSGISLKNKQTKKVFQQSLNPDPVASLMHGYPWSLRKAEQIHFNSIFANRLCAHLPQYCYHFPVPK